MGCDWAAGEGNDHLIFLKLNIHINWITKVHILVIQFNTPFLLWTLHIGWQIKSNRYQYTWESILVIFFINNNCTKVKLELQKTLCYCSTNTMERNLTHVSVSSLGLFGADAVFEASLVEGAGSSVSTWVASCGIHSLTLGSSTIVLSFSKLRTIEISLTWSIHNG